LAATAAAYPGAVLEWGLDRSEVTGEVIALLLVCKTPFDVGTALDAMEKLVRSFWIPLPREVWRRFQFHLDFLVKKS